VDGGHHDRVQVALAPAVALGGVEAHLVGGDALRAVAARDHPVHCPEDALRAALDQLGEVVDAVEALEAVGAAAHVGRPRELPVVAKGELDALLVRQLPHGGGVDAAAQVGVQLGQALVGPEHRGLHRGRGAAGG
jgi:hypothetical protein